LRNVRQDVNRS